MSDSANANTAGSARESSAPGALIHEKILEAAASMQDATMAEVAEEVSGASTDLVAASVTDRDWDRASQ